MDGSEPTVSGSKASIQSRRYGKHASFTATTGKWIMDKCTVKWKSSSVAANELPRSMVAQYPLASLYNPEDGDSETAKITAKLSPPSSRYVHQGSGR